MRICNRVTGDRGGMGTRVARPSGVTAFTMVEIAICLAIIGVALVSIIGVLPLGMRTQRDNREQTVINQDASVLMEAIRNGVMGADDLTNYVYAISNFWGVYLASGALANGGTGIDGYTYSNSFLSAKPSPMIRPSPRALNVALTNGMHIIGVMSMPEFMDTGFNPTNNLFNGGLSNHIVAYVRSISGPATEKPPQNNGIVLGDAFSYRVFCVNAPVAMDTNMYLNPTLYPYGVPPYNQQLAASLHELRLTFLWPQLPSGSVGNGRQTFRAMVGGQIMRTNVNNEGNQLLLYFYQPQTYTNVVALP